MIYKTTLKWILLLVVALSATRVIAQEKTAFKTEKEKVSYAIGVELAGNLKRQGIEVDVDFLLKGLRMFHTAMRQKQMKLKEGQAGVMKITADKNKKEGEAFLAENKAKEGVVTLPSGLQYRILKLGDGRKPAETDSVECHYRGTLIDGTEFDSSYPTGKPATFKVTGVIPGWTEALKLMPVGSKWQIFIPPQLAYGDRGAGRDIGPNATLIFELELLAIQ